MIYIKYDCCWWWRTSVYWNKKNNRGTTFFHFEFTFTTVEQRLSEANVVLLTKTFSWDVCIVAWMLMLYIFIALLPGILFSSVLFVATAALVGNEYSRGIFEIFITTQERQTGRLWTVWQALVGFKLTKGFWMNNVDWSCQIVQSCHLCWTIKVSVLVKQCGEIGFQTEYFPLNVSKMQTCKSESYLCRNLRSK